MQPPPSSHFEPSPWFGADRKPPQHYRGIRAMADTNLHEQLADMVLTRVPRGAFGSRRPRVLDLGCGEGALAQRLHDLGYEVLAVDRAAGAWKADGPAFAALDLDDDAALGRFVASQRGQFDLILAVEVIEHLRCPWYLVRACRELCRPDTHVLITTPNVGSWWGRVWFLLTGDLWGFGPESWQDPGHISPLPASILRGVLRDCGLDCLEVTPAGRLPVIWAYNWKRLLLSLAVLPLRTLMRGPKDGWVLCYHAKPSA